MQLAKHVIVQLSGSPLGCLPHGRHENHSFILKSKFVHLNRHAKENIIATDQGLNSFAARKSLIIENSKDLKL